MKAKILIMVLLFTVSVCAQYITSGHDETRTCIICGDGWSEYVGDGNNDIAYYFIEDNRRNLLSLLHREEEEGIKWRVDLYGGAEAFLCKHCDKIYGDFWRRELIAEFKKLLNEAIGEQKDYSIKVKLNLKNKKLDELNKKVEELKKQIDEQRLK